MELWNVYIMSNRPDRVLYIGVTDNFDERVKEHKLKAFPKSFTAKYNCDKLVYFEKFENGEEAVKARKTNEKVEEGVENQFNRRF